MSRLLTIVTLVLVGILGCNRAATESDVIGTWVISAESRQQYLPAAQQKASATIFLDGNGSFVATELPEDLLYGPPEAAEGLVTGSGRWKLTSRGYLQEIQLDFYSIAVGQRAPVPYGTQLNVSRGWSTIGLFYFQG